MLENMKSDKRNVLISILNWNSSIATLECIDSLQGQNTDGVTVKLAVIDNGSRDDEWRILAAGAQTRGIVLNRQESNLGFAGGHNLSMQAAIDSDYDFVWLVNNDATVHADALEKMIRIMEKDSSCGAVAPLCIAEHDPQHIDFLGARHDWKNLASVRSSSLIETASLEKTNPDAQWIAGTAALFRVTALKQIGLLDEKLFAYFEDNDISARLAAAGWKNRVALDAKVIHACHQGKDTNRPPYFFYLMQRNFFHFWRKNTPPAYRRFLSIRLLDRSLYEVNRLYYGGYKELGDAALLGTSDGFWGVFGAPRLDRSPSRSIIFLTWLLSIPHGRALKRLALQNKLSVTPLTEPRR
jgi:GT2 family glycosyltransferase